MCLGQRAMQGAGGVGKTPKGSKPDLQALFSPPAAPSRTIQEKRRVLYYPDAYKRHYMDLLGRYKEMLSDRSGKPVGWQAIRDLVMAPEDERLAREVMDRDKVDVAVGRPRSGLVTLEDFKGWYHPQKSHLPSDIKFQYIERYIRLLRVTGEMDEIERTLDAVQLEYIREALHLFYRPVPYAGETEILREINSEAIERLVSRACFEVEAELLDLPKGEKGLCLLSFRDYVSHITPFDIVLIRVRPGGEPPVLVPVFAGFLVTETVLGLGLAEADQIVLRGKLVMTKETGASVGDDGVRVLCEGTNLEAMVTFGEKLLEITLGNGDGLQLLGPLFGVEEMQGSGGESVNVVIRRTEPSKYLPDAEQGLFFRYRPWP